MIKIGTFNTNGSQIEKLDYITSEMRYNNLDILAIQETHLNTTHNTKLFYKHTFQYYTKLNNNFHKSSFQGTGVMMKYKFKRQSTNFNIIPGRLQLTSIYINRRKINIINIYAPTGDDAKKNDDPRQTN